MPKRLSNVRKAPVPTARRTSVTLTQAAADLLQSECDYRRDLEGALPSPSRIINELILAHLVDHRNGSSAPRPIAKPSREFKKPPPAA